MLTVKKLADLAGVSVRTLHYYDKVGLLQPQGRDRNGYRYYGAESVTQLQQIMFFRELGFSLDDIRNILLTPEFNLLEALREQKLMLKKKKARIDELLTTLDKTILSENGELKMEIKEYYEGFSEETIERYRDEVQRRWGERVLEDSEAKVVAMGKESFMKLQAEGGNIFKKIYENMDQGYNSKFIQAQIAAWRLWLENFHHYSDEEVAGLGQAYSQNREFAQFFDQYDADLPLFLTKAIEYYCSHKK